MATGKIVFDDGVPSGLGTRYYPDGQVVKGLWQKGYFVYAERDEI